MFPIWPVQGRSWVYTGLFHKPKSSRLAGTKEPGCSYQRRAAGALPARSSLAARHSCRSVLCILHGQIRGCFSSAIRGSWSALTLPRPPGRGRHTGGLHSRAWQLLGFIKEGAGLGNRLVLSFCAADPPALVSAKLPTTLGCLGLPTLSAPAPPASRPWGSVTKSPVLFRTIQGSDKVEANQCDHACPLTLRVDGPGPALPTVCRGSEWGSVAPSVSCACIISSPGSVFPHF